jgi:murein DD-endopeptidase MepM/ murein hydrolase activator NlpD
MRFQLIIGLLTIVSTLTTGFAAPSWDGGTEKRSGADSTALRSDASPSSEGVVIRRLHISASDVNPNLGQVARWDTADINMYNVDMTQFQDTLVYHLQDENSAWKYTIPRKGMVTSGFGVRSLFGRRFHKGLDIDLETGDPIVAAFEGVVRIARYNKGYGNMVVISHEGGMETLYGHMSQLDVQEGQIVQSGQQIGLGGSTGQSTGAHLHFEIRIMGEQVDPSWVISTETLMPLTPVVKVDKTWFQHLAEMREVDMHVVVAGETVDQIAALYELDRATLLQLNGLEESTTQLTEGTRLKLD